jgi:hypothetical protein
MTEEEIQLTQQLFALPGRIRARGVESTPYKRA